MKLSKIFFAATTLLGGLIAAQANEGTETFRYESDITRLRSLVVHSLYSHKDVFLRELLSNANDALEKLRLVSLTDRSVLSAGEGNVTVEVIPNPDESLLEPKTGKIIIRDTGIGMSKDELTRNLGTIARSGTNEFLKKAEEGQGVDGNLIGQFGLGFYSCFLVSPTVKVSSLPPATSSNPGPIQHTFVSYSTGDSFEVYPDPRGNTLGRGTEIVLEIGEEEAEFLSIDKLKSLIEKHSTFSTTFPIYIKERKITKIPTPPPQSPVEDGDPDEFAHDLETDETTPKEDSITEAEEENWIRVNDKAPIWMRDPKEVSDEEYKAFYQAVSKDDQGEPLGWSHFKGDTGSGVSFRTIMYIPSSLPKDFWSKMTSGINNVRLMVKRVFITDDLGEDFMPRWLSYLKVTVDADDLPLNVSRETLQNNRFLSQLQRILVRKALDLFTKVSNDQPGKYKEIAKMYGNALRIGLMETPKDKLKIARLLRFESTRSNYTTLEEYVENRKEGQKQMYYIAGVGETARDLAKSPFVEKLHARGYEVLLLNLPSDEPMMAALDQFMGMTTQDVSKKGLKFGDEDEDEAEKKELEAQKIAFRPLIEWLKKDLAGQINDVTVTNRLVTSPCTIIVDSWGWSANMQRIMSAQTDSQDDPMFNMMKNLPKVLEINPKSPLIEGLLEKVLDLPQPDDDEEDGDAKRTSEEEEELRETVRILFDTSLVRSGFSVADPTTYFERVEALLRRSLGVSLSAKPKIHIRPAPPTAAGPIPEDEEAEEQKIEFDPNDMQDMLGDPSQWADWQDIKKQMGVEHDEL
ncbi:cation-transporting ATPase [Kwoniella mangroviensis CBS 10435]|uniref:Cation-transporting ATPase n=1 Tax=Kwoniella mangroviensis CBS 10435 TaxID=1331196 RepID=A0A1B9J1U0_9TREE|nr:cation-transporting ATPase [Kwoniella mangroviensis CBS 10435]OCF77769.1 cation-transporting ATPase [Kwoniella mangroviensis CBS 8886]